MLLPRTSRPRRLKPMAVAMPLALVALLSACGSSTKTAAPAAATSSAPTSSAPSTSSPSTSSPAVAGVAQVLTGVVGVKNAFVITLVDSSGAPVTTLKAGAYQVKVDDASKIHNFHLTGPGVEKTTTVPELKQTTWDITLSPGTYTFHCDPHKKMTGRFTVT